MKTHVSERSLSTLVIFVKFASLAATVAGIAVLLGWIFNITALKSFLPGLATMKPLTALEILLAGSALWLQQQEYALVWQKRLRMLLAGLVAVIGGIILGEYIFNINPGIDQWLFPQSVLAEGGLHPGRPAPATALCLFLLGLAFFNVHGRSNWILPLLTLPILLISVLALVGYAYGVSSLYQIGPYSSMALHTAFLVVILSLGVLSTRPQHPLMALLTSDLAGGVMFRRLVFAAILIPSIFGWLRLQGELLGWYDGRFGLALYATSNILIFVGLIYWNAHLLNQTDLYRANAFDSLRENESRLAGMIGSAMDAIITINAEQKITLFNAAAEKIFGYPAEEMMGESLNRLLPAEYHAIHRDHIRQFGETGVSTRVMGSLQALRGRRSNGEEFPLEASISQITIDGKKLYTVILRDITTRRQAEENVAYQAQLLAHVTDAIVASDHEYRLTAWNAAAEEMYGWRAEEVLGQVGLEILQTDFPQVDPHEMRRKITETGSWHGEATQLRKDGTRIPVDVASIVLHDANGQISGYLSVNRDITERKRAEAAAREHQYRQKKILDTMFAFVGLFSLDGITLEVNNAPLEAAALKAEDVVDKPFTDAYWWSHSKDTQHQVQEAIRRAALGETVRDDFLVRILDGQLITIDAVFNPLRDASGKIIQVVASGVDITARKKAEQEIQQLNATLEKRVEERTAELEKEVSERTQAEGSLARERDLLQALMDNIPDMIYFKDTSSLFTRINRAQANFLGVDTPQAAIGKNDFDFQRENLADEFYKEEQKIFESGVPVIDRSEYHPTIHGTPRWFSATKMPLKDADGKVTGMVGISRDITERKRMEDALHSSNEQLRRSISEVERRNREILLLSEVTNLLESSETTQEAYEILQRYLPRLFPAEAGSLFINSPSRKLLEAYVNWGGFEAMGEKSFPPSDCWALRRGRAHIVRSVQSDVLCKHLTNTTQPILSPYICIPLMAHGEALGVFHLQCDPGDVTGITPARELLAFTAAEQFSLSFANINLRETLRIQSIRDPLTGLFNRRYLEESMQRELNRAERNRTQLGVVMLDLDHFKKFNDMFGHAAGDAALREFGKLILSRLRGSDIACRYGGEEFTLLLSEVDPQNMLGRLESLREEVKRMTIQFNGNALGSFTVSGGIAFFPQHGHSAESLFKAADDALYLAKHSGRDRVLVSASSDA